MNLNLNLNIANKDGQYGIEVSDDLLSAEECKAFKAHMHRCVWLSTGGGMDFVSWSTLAGFTNVVHGYEFLSSESCVADGAPGENCGYVQCSFRRMKIICFRIETQPTRAARCAVILSTSRQCFKCTVFSFVFFFYSICIRG